MNYKSKLNDKSRLNDPNKPKAKCPVEPGYETTDTNGKSNGKTPGGNLSKSPSEAVAKKKQITKAHWRYLYKLKADAMQCKCGCDGNPFECRLDSATKYRNLRHYIFDHYKAYVKKIASISYARRSNSKPGFQRVVSKDDTVSSALQTMLRRIDSYDCDDVSGAAFKTYIFIGTYNAVIDEMRILSDFPNVVAPRKRAITEARTQATADASYNVTDEELFEFAERTYDDKAYCKLKVAYSDPLSHRMNSNQSVGGSNGNGSGSDGEDLHDNIEGACEGSELTLAYRRDPSDERSAFSGYLGMIKDERTRDVVALSYCSDLSAGLIAAVMGLTPSMVSKLKKHGESEIRVGILELRREE